MIETFHFWASIEGACRAAEWQQSRKSAANHNSGKVDYNLYSNNCTDAAVNVVNSSGAGITIANSATTVKPNSWIKEVKDDSKAVSREEDQK
ncbi:MAG: hypothetical protein WA191_13350 [Telluria sp.]